MGARATLLVALVASLTSAGCDQGLTPKRADRVVVGVEASLRASGLAEYLRAAFEDAHKIRVELVHGDADAVASMCERGDVDVALTTSDRVVERLRTSGVAERVEPFAHEELVIIGPTEDKFRAHGSTDAVEFLKNVTRSNYKFLVPKKGSSEHHRYRTISKRTGDRPGAGTHLLSGRTGIDLVKYAVKENAFALVRRTSVVLAAADGVKPHRVYQDGQPQLVSRLTALSVHPSRTKRDRKQAFADFLVSEAGQAAVASYGKSRFGLPLYAPGVPEEGAGATSPAPRPSP